jgi:hypothetical protein
MSRLLCLRGKILTPFGAYLIGIVMPIFEVESWRVAEGKEEEHGKWLRRWLQWVNDHRELFPEWRSVRYFVKTIAGEESERHMVIWEYDSLAAFEAYKARRGDYEGPYAEYKENDPYYKGVFNHQSMKVEVWKDLERDLWIE